MTVYTQSHGSIGTVLADMMGMARAWSIANTTIQLLNPSHVRAFAFIGLCVHLFPLHLVQRTCFTGLPFMLSTVIITRMDSARRFMQDEQKK